LTIDRLAAASAPRIGVAGAVIVFVGIALLFAFEQPPFVAPDETAHVGYAHEIAGFELPAVTKFPDVPDSAVQWQAERESGRDDRYRAVWVANHPPLHYVLTAPSIWLSNALDRPDGGLMFMRLANTAFAAIGVVLTYLLGRDLSGGVGRIGVAGAAIAALVPQGHTLFSQAMNDGIGFAAATAVVWAAVRCVGTGEGRYGRGDLALLGAAAAACAGARSATLAVAVVVVIWVAVTRLLTAPGSIGGRLAAAAQVAVVGLLPAALLFGWHYLRNDRLYGDFAGSQFLLDRFGRMPRGSLFDILSWGHLWVDLYHMLLSPSPFFPVQAPPGVTPALVLAAIGLVVVAITGRTGDVIRHGEGSASDEPLAARGESGADDEPASKHTVHGVVTRPALALCVVVLCVVITTVAQHISGGGNRYARYLLPALGVAAALFVLGLDRLWPRVLPAVAVVLLGWWALRNVPSGVDPAAELRPRDRGDPMPELLQVLPASPWLRTAAGFVIVIGCALLAVWIAATVARALRRG
jgi:hypothetical protein